MLHVALVFCAALVPNHNPLRLTPIKMCRARALAQVAKANGVRPDRLVAIAWVESRLNPDVRPSHTRDHGMMQVNCPLWHRSLGYVSRSDCALYMRDPDLSTAAALHVIITYRTRHRHCRGNGVYRCYNGGPRWRRSRNIKRIHRYRKRAIWAARQWRRYYQP